MKLTSMQKILLAGAAILIAMVAVIILLIVPMFGELSTLEADAQAASLSKQQAQALLGQLQQAKQRAAETQAELLKIGTQIPDSPQMPTLIIEMQNMANASGLGLMHLSPKEPVAAASGGYSEITIETHVLGGWDDLLDFMRRINKATRLLRVTDFAIVPVTPSANTTATPGESQVSVNMTVKAYVLKTSGSSSTATTP